MFVKDSAINQFNFSRILLTSLSFLLFATGVGYSAEDSEGLKKKEVEMKQKGVELIKRKMEAYTADDQTSTVTIHLYTKEGDEKKIATKRYWKNYKDKNGIASKTIFFTEFPPDARGTGFLIQNFSEPNKPDDLLLYLPSSRNVMHVSSRDRS